MTKDVSKDVSKDVTPVSLFEENIRDSLEYALNILELQKDKFKELSTLSSQQLGEDAEGDSAMFLDRAEKIETALKTIYSLRYDIIGLQAIVRRDIKKHGDCRSCEWHGSKECMVYWASDTECVNGDHYQYTTNGFIPLWKVIKEDTLEGDFLNACNI